MLNFGMFNARYPIVNQDGTPTRSFYGFCRAVWDALGGGQNMGLPGQVEVNTQSIVTETEDRQDADEQIIENVYTKQQTDELIADTLGNVEELLREI